MSILITGSTGVALCLGVAARAKVSMMIMRPPQHGHGRGSTDGSPVSAALAISGSGAAGKVVAKLLAEGLIEEFPSRGSRPAWRRDDDGARSLRITRKGLAAIRVEEEPADAVVDEKKPPRPVRETAQVRPSTAQSRGA